MQLQNLSQILNNTQILWKIIGGLFLIIVFIYFIGLCLYVYKNRANMFLRGPKVHTKDDEAKLGKEVPYDYRRATVANNELKKETRMSVPQTKLPTMCPVSKYQIVLSEENTHIQPRDQKTCSLLVKCPCSCGEIHEFILPYMQAVPSKKESWKITRLFHNSPAFALIKGVQAFFANLRSNQGRRT